MGAEIKDEYYEYSAGEAIDYFEAKGHEIDEDKRRLRALENRFNFSLVNNNFYRDREFGAIFKRKILYRSDITEYFEKNRIKMGNEEHMRLEDLQEYLSLANKYFDFVISHFDSCEREIDGDIERYNREMGF